MEIDIIKIALAEYGNQAYAGNATNPDVLKYFHDIGFQYVDDDETPWCAAFANWVLKEAVKKGSGSLLARSFLNVGKETTTPQLGDIVVFWRISKDSMYGHVGFYIRETDHLIYVLGGNQDSEVCIKPMPKSQLLGFRRVE